MPDVASRELRNNTRSLLDRVAAGETLTITVDGRPVARLEPVDRRPRWLHREELLRGLVQTDPGLTEELQVIAGDSTDDAPLR